MRKVRPGRVRLVVRAPTAYEVTELWFPVVYYPVKLML
jgi:hypothetical protein